MAGNTAAAYGIFSQDVVLADIVSTLNQAGFENEDICMMLPPAHPVAALVREATFSSSKQDSAASAGLIGWLSRFGAVVIPTVGFFIRSQAFFRALMTAREAPSFCGKGGTLLGLGFSEQEARRFEDQRGVLVYVSCAESTKTTWAREILQHIGAREAATLNSAICATVDRSAMSAAVAA
jgi:hypothetical protein